MFQHLKKGDILISNIRPYFKKIWFADIDGGASTDVLVIKNKNRNKISDEFLYYTLFKDDFFDYVMSGAKGTKMPRGDKNAIMKYQIVVPNIEEQKKIVNLFISLDKKIELNNEMNKTLEEMAQALFKRWFVDFEFPNDEGKPYKSSGGEMVESELGMIPKGWNVDAVGELGKVITGKTPPTKNAENYGDEYNFITPVDMKNECYIIETQRKLSRVGYEKVKNFIVPTNSIGVTCIGSNLGEVYINDKECFTNQQINSLILRDEDQYPYFYIALKRMKDDFLNIAGGSAVPIINKTTFSQILVLIPNKKELDCFSTVTMKIFERIKENTIQNINLKELRDSLLPKLMSGEIRVDNVETDI